MSMILFRIQLSLFLLQMIPLGNLSAETAVNERLGEAQKELRLAEAAYAQVRTRFEDLQKNPNATPEQVLAMETYVFELQEMVKIRRATWLDLQELAGIPSEDANPIVTDGMDVFAGAVSNLPDAEDPESEQEKLEREFLASLEAFDGMILAYNQKLADKMDQRMATGEASAGAQKTATQEAEALLRSLGVDPETGENAGATTATKPSGTGETSPEGAGNQTAAGGEQAVGSGEQGNAGVGEPRPPRGDEDIVARQLREAAENEKDPVLREKLWIEYEAYLNGQS